MDAYPICKMEAFVESIGHLENINSRRTIIQNFVSAQSDAEGIKKFLKDLRTKKTEKPTEEAVEDFLTAFQAGFKGQE